MPENTVESNLTPPSGSPEQAQKYLEKLIDLLDQEKVLVTHTDLSKLDPSSLQDHYYITLNDYHVEVSHTKKAETGEDFYILLFNNLKQIRDGCSEKVILAYMNLTSEQFEEFKESAKLQLDKIKAKEDAKRFSEAMSPIDMVLEKFNSSNSIPETQVPEPISFEDTPLPEPIPESVSEPVQESVQESAPDSLPEIPIFNEPVPQNSVPQTPAI
ncbi:MAG: hypothetical protein Q7R43_03785 [Candidatus Daviesbacteria bacterium]|nr:hypothetical protein [Candidatus Daviesbacteria bacterium]